mmetsp:Transcript_49140/g.92132  ORF Transcript_49140/g.92132 Transcript_49140/m.92132 type:complete len:219 (-) Transcript_49140:191-847(-)
MLQQELDGRARTNTLHGVAVITAAQNAEVDELIHGDVQLFEHQGQIHLQNSFLLRLCGHEIPDQDLCAEGQAVRILCGSREDLPVSAESCASRLRLAGRINHRNAHETQELFGFLVLLLGDLHSRLGALEDLLGISSLHCSLEVGLRLLALGAPLLELQQLHLWRLAVEDVHGLDATLHQPDRAGQHANDVRCDLALFVGQVVVRSRSVFSDHDQELV